MPESILITGADGFAGQALKKHLIKSDLGFRSAVRRADAPDKSVFAVGDISGQTDWSAALQGMDTVVHLAGRAHILREKHESASIHAEINCLATLNLAQQAAAMGVRRFIFASSAHVHGRDGLNRSCPGNEESPLNPQDVYARSKAEAEAGLNRIAAQTGLEVTIIRPVLMYGPGVKGNLASLLKWLPKRLPWPLGLADNRRSFLNVNNFADFIIRCRKAPQAAGQTFLLTDDRDISTPELFRLLGQALNVKVGLWPCPPALLRLGGRLTGRRRMISQLLDDLCFDCSKAKKLLNWQPPFGLEDGLKETADHFQQHQDSI